MLRITSIALIASLALATAAWAQGNKQYDGVWAGLAKISKSGCLSFNEVKITIANGAITGESQVYGEKSPNKLVSAIKGKVDAAGKLSWTTGGERKSKAEGNFADGKFSVTDSTANCAYGLILQRKN